MNQNREEIKSKNNWWTGWSEHDKGIKRESEEQNKTEHSSEIKVCDYDGIPEWESEIAMKMMKAIIIPRKMWRRENEKEEEEGGRKQ